MAGSYQQVVDPVRGSGDAVHKANDSEEFPQTIGREAPNLEYQQLLSKSRDIADEGFMQGFLKLIGETKGKNRPYLPQHARKDIEATIYDNSTHAEWRKGKLISMHQIIKTDLKRDEEPTPGLLRCLSDRRVKWADIVMLLTATCSCIVTPLTFLFGGSWDNPTHVPGGRDLLYCDAALDVFYGAYLMMQLNTSFLHPRKRVEVVNRARILGWLLCSPRYWFECLSLTVYVFIICGNVTLLLNIVKAMRLVRFSHIPDSLWHLRDSSTVRLVRPMLLILFGAHWLACLLCCVGGYSDRLKDNGSDYFRTSFFGKPVSGRVSIYLMAFVEALYMLTGSMDNPLGEGDSARNKNFGSLVVVSIFGPVGCVVAAMFIATVVRTQNLMFALDMRQQSNKAFIQRALENLDMPQTLQDRVFSLHTYQKMGHDQLALEHLFERKFLSNPTMSALRVFLYQDSVIYSRYFYKKDTNYILEVVRVLQDQMFLPGDYVIRRGEVGNQMYFVGRGVLSVVCNNKVLNELKGSRGDFFGEIALVKDCMRTASVRADTYVHVYTLARHNVESIWKYYPEEKVHLEAMITKAAHCFQLRKATNTSLSTAFQSTHSLSAESLIVADQASRQHSPEADRADTYSEALSEMHDNSATRSTLATKRSTAKRVDFKEPTSSESADIAGDCGEVSQVASHTSSIGTSASEKHPQRKFARCVSKELTAGMQNIGQQVEELLARQADLEQKFFTAVSRVTVNQAPQPMVDDVEDTDGIVNTGNAKTLPSGGPSGDSGKRKKAGSAKIRRVKLTNDSTATGSNREIPQDDFPRLDFDAQVSIPRPEVSPSQGVSCHRD